MTFDQSVHSMKLHFTLFATDIKTGVVENSQSSKSDILKGRCKCRLKYRMRQFRRPSWCSMPFNSHCTRASTLSYTAGSANHGQGADTYSHILFTDLQWDLSHVKDGMHGLCSVLIHNGRSRRGLNSELISEHDTKEAILASLAHLYVIFYNLLNLKWTHPYCVQQVACKPNSLAETKGWFDRKYSTHLLLKDQFLI